MKVDRNLVADRLRLNGSVGAARRSVGRTGGIGSDVVDVRASLGEERAPQAARWSAGQSGW
jgi:hypothetical protein